MLFRSSEPTSSGRPTARPAAEESAPRWLGRAVALALAALFVMVALGVVWVWQRSSREQRWRDQVNATEPFQAPANPAR